MGKGRKAQQEDREASSKGGLPSKFIQSQINVILCSNEKPDVGVRVGGHRHNAVLCLCHRASCGVRVYDTPSLSCTRGRWTQEGGLVLRPHIFHFST